MLKLKDATLIKILRVLNHVAMADASPDSVTDGT